MILPIIVALRFRKHLNKPLYIMLGYFIMTFLINILEQLFIWSSGQYYQQLKPFLDYFAITNTHFLSIFYYLKDFLLLGWFFSLVIPKAHTIIKSGSLLLALAVSINYFFIEGYQVFGVFNPNVNILYVLILPLWYLWASQKQTLRIPLQNNPYFWIAIGLFIPNLLALFLYFTGDYIYDTNFPLYAQLVSVKNTLEIIGFLMVCKGFSLSRFHRFIE